MLTRLAISAASFLLLALHVAGAPRFEIIDRIENYLYDVRIRMTMPGTVDDRVVIIDIDEASQLELGQWPWPRATIARILDRLFDDYEIRVLGLDVLFAEAEDTPSDRLLRQLDDGELLVSDEARIELMALLAATDGNAAFAEALIARDVVTGIVFKDGVAEGEPRETGALPVPLFTAADIIDLDVPFQSPEGFVANLPALQENAVLGGFFDSPLIDADGVFRRTPLLQRYGGDLFPSLGLATAYIAMGSPPLELQFAGEKRSGVDLEYFVLGGQRIPVDQHTAVYIPYRGPQESFPFVSAKDVLDGSVDKQVLRGRIALLGASAAGLLDLRSTPVGQRYIGVEAHANLVAGLIDGNIRYTPAYANGFELVSLFLIAMLTALLLPRLAPISGLLLIAGIAVVSMLFNLWMWSSQMLVLPIASLLVCTLLTALLHITYGFFIESRNKRHLSQIFGQYIPPKLVEEIDASGAEVSLEGETREMSVLFSDVRSFTSISEGLNARELTQMMNEFLTPFTRAIQDHRGTIDKYMGDCVMAFWGAPLRDAEHAEHAIDSAFDMLRALSSLEKAFTAKGWPEIRVGVGIASGDMNVGNMGSEFRVAYTVMGDTVNLGSRLEGLTKQYGVEIIVSARTTKLATAFQFRELDLVRVKGKSEPVAIFEPLGRKADIATDTQIEVKCYEEALASYRRQDWQAAKDGFENLSQQHDHLLYNVYLERIERFMAQPPSHDWDGVFDHLTK